PKLTTEGNDLIYIIDFTPKRKEDFEGTLYVNSADFAITRLDFNNIKSLFRIKLLGVLYDDYLKSGKMIFSKINEKKYGLSYLQISGGEKIKIDRPIKFVEKNKFVKGRRKQNQISMRLDLSLITNSDYEVRVFESKKLSQDEFDEIEEKNEVLPKYYKEFKTNFWEEF
ncbi:MAG: carboxypeptidase-like regulatory domain-containing protein, partial [Flavobacteriaceae bacterium]|nr:carboxypeptidase-like regulatory domain-containing protein [Flavobacteriaceae bacterium]